MKNKKILEKPGMVYALELMGCIPLETGKKTVLIGKSTRMQWHTQNARVPNNFKLIHYVIVDRPTAVKKLIEIKLHKDIYMAGKSYYISTKKYIIDVFNVCAKIIETGKFPTKCIRCDEKINSLSRLIDHTKKHNKQIGGIEEFGSDTDFYHKYLKYRFKYLNLKETQT